MIIGTQTSSQAGEARKTTEQNAKAYEEAARR
jgi:hypothetical protein